ncbi:hypothetical protein HZH66_014764 [Vespula vulgaris]|uniref:Uncharacterized protein n=1 Tax=Vespula vulgaris TaxID=7454 RepID=A0A834IYT7_VESVU|nr:hypothetical protein HZH66_014764 [Vespula vulgaris]
MLWKDLGDSFSETYELNSRYCSRRVEKDPCMVENKGPKLQVYNCPREEEEGREPKTDVLPCRIQVSHEG